MPISQQNSGSLGGSFNALWLGSLDYPSFITSLNLTASHCALLQCLTPSKDSRPLPQSCRISVTWTHTLEVAPQFPQASKSTLNLRWSESCLWGYFQFPVGRAGKRLCWSHPGPHPCTSSLFLGTLIPLVISSFCHGFKKHPNTANSLVYIWEVIGGFRVKKWWDPIHTWRISSDFLPELKTYLFNFPPGSSLDIHEN